MLHSTQSRSRECSIGARHRASWYWQGVSETYRRADMAKGTVQEQGPCHSRNRQVVHAKRLR